MEKANWTFEEQWSQALGGTEVTPPAQVWVAIDGQLANEQALGYKKQADFYRWVAAACVLLFILGSSVFYWVGNNNTIESVVVENEAPTIDSAGKNTSSPILIAEDSDEETGSDTDKEKGIESIETKKVQARVSTGALPNVTPFAGRSEVKSMARYSTASSAQMAALSPIQTSQSTVLEPWRTDHLYGVARTWEAIEVDQSTLPLWAGVSFSTGSFDPGFGGSSGNDMLFANQEGFTAESAQVQNQSGSPAYSSGQSVAGGLNVGKKISKRFMVSGGLLYSAFNTGSASSQIVADSDNAYALTNETSDSNLENALAEGNLRYAGEQVQLANEYEYLTVPIKAGYLLLDKKFNITLNTGLSSNILVDSKLVSSGASDELNNDFSTSQSYESVYFNFLTSVEFGYVFRKHYQLLLEPNYNQALTNFTNSNHGDRAKPRSLGLAIGFRYNF